MWLVPVVRTGNRNHDTTTEFQVRSGMNERWYMRWLGKLPQIGWWFRGEFACCGFAGRAFYLLQSHVKCFRPDQAPNKEDVMNANKGDQAAVEKLRFYGSETDVDVPKLKEWVLSKDAREQSLPRTLYGVVINRADSTPWGVLIYDSIYEGLPSLMHDLSGNVASTIEAILEGATDE